MTKEYRMAQHGYLREYDEGWNRGGDRDQDDGSRRRDRDRGIMFGEGPGRDDSGRFDRMGDRARERFSNDDRQWRGSIRNSANLGDSNRQRAPRSFSNHQDDHYRSWRDRQIEALDRDYEDYCREREQQFHSDFDSWRSQRHGNPAPLQTGMTQTGLSADPSGMTQLSENTDQSSDQPDPMADATMGTSSSRNRR